jgi:mycoredoxin
VETTPIQLFGASWCGDCVRAQALLEHYGVDFDYHDVETSEENRQRAIEISGLQKIPVLVFPDGSVLTEPSNPMLNDKLTELDLI